MRKQQSNNLINAQELLFLTTEIVSWHKRQFQQKTAQEHLAMSHVIVV